MKEISKFNWTGRTDHETNWENFRYHQIIKNQYENSCALIGFSCDEGVRRNNGRVGAAEAPNALRAALANMPWRLPKDTHLVDVGNVICKGEKMELAQRELGHVVKSTLDSGSIPIILGGGHETFYGHYLGARSHLGKGKKLGIINIDAHFDLRPYDEQSSSGTMFSQILENDENAGYLVLGIQRYGNTESLFQKAEKLGCEYICEDELTEEIQNEAIDLFILRHDAIIITLCMDVVCAASAPGVSAPSALGLNPKVVRSIIRRTTKNLKTLSFDIAEVNPSLDSNGHTVKLGAAFVNEAVMCFSTREK